MSWFTNQRGCGLCVNNKSSVHCNSLPSPRKRLHQINMVYFRALTCELIYTNLVFTHPYNCLNTCKFIHDPSQPLSFIFKMMPLIVTVIPEHRFLWNDTHLFQIINTILKSKYYFKSYWLTIWGWTESRASWYTDSVPGAGVFFFPLLTALGLHCFALAFSSCRNQGLLFAAHCDGFSCCGTQALDTRASGVAARWPVGSSQTRGKPVSPALAGRFLSTAPRGKSQQALFQALFKC